MTNVLLNTIENIPETKIDKNLAEYSNKILRIRTLYKYLEMKNKDSLSAA